MKWNGQEILGGNGSGETEWDQIDEIKASFGTAGSSAQYSTGTIKYKMLQFKNDIKYYTLIDIQIEALSTNQWLYDNKNILTPDNTNYSIPYKFFPKLQAADINQGSKAVTSSNNRLFVITLEPQNLTQTMYSGSNNYNYGAEACPYLYIKFGTVGTPSTPSNRYITQDGGGMYLIKETALHGTKLYVCNGE